MGELENLGSIMHKAGMQARSGRGAIRVVDADRVEPEGEKLGGGPSELPVVRYSKPDRALPRPISDPSRLEPMVEQVRPKVSATLPEPLKPKLRQVCPICHGAGFLRQNVPYGHPQFGKLKKCQCKVREQTQALFGGAHIPDDFGDNTFTSYFRLPLLAEQRQAAMLVQAFVVPRLEDDYEGRKRGLYLYGQWGVGKTGLAVSALRMALDAGHTGLYLPTYELFDILYESIAASNRIQHGYGGEDDKEGETAGSKLLRLVESVEWLVLDDLGVECGSRFVISRLYRIIEGRRSHRGLYTVFTSNKDARGLEQHWRPERSGAAAFDDCERIIQRIGEYCTPVHVAGRSLREK